MQPDDQPSLMHAEPVLAVGNIVETVTYWHEVLGFTNKWTWGTPPNHGGVSWNNAAFIQASLNPQLAKVSEGHSVWIRADNLEALYKLHERNKANIVLPITDRPWGMAEYIVKDINGYYINFSAPSKSRTPQSRQPDADFQIVHRRPSIPEFKRLMASVGWPVTISYDAVNTEFKAIAHAVVAEEKHSGSAIGCAFVMGDNLSFYYVKDVVVDPRWQGKRAGTSMMSALMHWLDQNAPDNATVGLFTGDHLASFYKQFGFIQACGMYKQIVRKKL